MAVKAERAVEPPALRPYAPSEEWHRTNRSASGCPGGLSSDILARSELATLLEQLGQPEEALCNWNAVLACDPNSLKAREGVARCRQRTGQPLQSVSVRGTMPTIWGHLENVNKAPARSAAYPGENIITWRNRHTGPREHWGTDSHRQRNRAG